MKKIYLTTLVFVAIFSLNAQILITGFEFPGGVEEPFNANIGQDNNQSYDIRMEDMDGTVDYPLVLKKGVGGDGDSAATASGWDNATNNKFMSIKLKAADYGHFTVSSQMRSINNNPGPADWKVMYKLSGGDWTDVPDSEYTIANDWTTGQIVDIAIPEAANNPASSLYLAWIATSNLDLNGNEVTAEGTIKIDNIMVYGYENTSIEEIQLESDTKCFPNPATSKVSISVDEKAISISAFDLTGKQVWENNNPKVINNMDVSYLCEGIYIIQIQYPTHMISRKLIVE